MAWDPAIAVLPRFREANALNLLCLQSEICQLELELQLAINNDDDSGDDANTYSCNIEKLRESAPDGNQWKACLRLREKLNEYSESSS